MDHNNKQMKNSNLFWGGILVALGVLFILNNLDFLHFDWWGIFRLWPMLLVLLGVTLLPIKNSIKLLLTLVLLVITIVLLFTNTSFYSGRSMNFNWDFGNRFEERNEFKRSDQYFYEPFDHNIQEASLDIEAVAGNFDIRGITDELFEFRQDGNVGPYVFSTNKRGNHQYLDLSIKNSNIRMRRLINDVSIELNPEPIWSINLDNGAAKIDLDLSKHKIKIIDIDGGASSTHLKIGDLQDKANINISAGASSVTISIPESLGCELSTDVFLSSKNFDGFNRIDKGLYQTSNFENADKKVFIDIDAAVTSLSVRRY